MNEGNALRAALSHSDERRDAMDRLTGAIALVESAHANLTEAVSQFPIEGGQERYSGHAAKAAARSPGNVSRHILEYRQGIALVQPRNRLHTFYTV